MVDLILYRNRTNCEKKLGFGANGGFGCTKEKRELIVKSYEKKRGLGSMVELISYRNRKNCEEKRWGLEPIMDLILLRN